MITTVGIVRVASSEHIAGKVPGAKLVVFDGAGHAAHITAAARLNRDLAEFVARECGGSAAVAVVRLAHASRRSRREIGGRRACTAARLFVRMHVT